MGEAGSGPVSRSGQNVSFRRGQREKNDQPSRCSSSFSFCFFLNQLFTNVLPSTETEPGGGETETEGSTLYGTGVQLEFGHCAQEPTQGL